ncbi:MULTISPECIES: GNAT family protein [Brevibacterium]|uniref:Protein N-acetyltransferase, RimJ/RimL family n=1 Tax=Brevibacterium antiquum CNRZ 918 TaxID=1255637 RepID=A0A2H1JFI7_9MICO|nr:MULTISPECIES: GNAT family protein [Brevibacterium]SMX86134.1 Protein N-acetyltransferase, RimJ/RimL family [Brevibacterium antiquum CNRZ 918]HCG56962.1 N-acetyltransferase [Brevibacterium sp.]
MAEFLRHWHRDDADALADIYARADTDLLSNIPDDRSLAGAHTWIDWIRAAEGEGAAVAFAIMRDEPTTAGNVPVGNVMATAIDRRHSTAWISYWLDSTVRGHGLAAAGLRSLVDHLHDELDVYRLELGYRINNPASGGVAKSAGFLVEGRERERLLYDGLRFDTEACARLSGDQRASGPRLPILTTADYVTR